MGQVNKPCCSHLVLDDPSKGGSIRLRRKDAASKAVRSRGARDGEAQAQRLEWQAARREKWTFSETPYQCYSQCETPVVEEVQGPIGEGEQMVRDNPEEYEGVKYETAMKQAAGEEQMYTLVRRTGSGFSVSRAKFGSFTYYSARYQALPPPKGILRFLDGYTDTVLASYHRERLAESLYPGRGEGAADVPSISLFGDVRPHSVKQGAVANGWLLSAISALSEFEGAIEALFECTKGGVKNRPRESFNRYAVVLYDISTEPAVRVCYDLDERLCVRTDGSGLVGCQPPADGELWACYLEKAVAIHCGGWDAVEWGLCTHAWRLLTGVQEQYTFLNAGGRGFQCLGTLDPSTRQWEKLENFPAAHGLWPMQWPEVGGGNPIGTRIGEDEMFLKMCEWEDASYVMTCSTKTSEAPDELAKAGDGFCCTVIACSTNPGSSKFDIVKLRGPRGAAAAGAGEFKSARWSQDGAGWTDFPDVRQELRPSWANDGVFFLEKSEFFRYFPTIYLCPLDMTDFVCAKSVRQAA